MHTPAESLYSLNVKAIYFVTGEFFRGFCGELGSVSAE